MHAKQAQPSPHEQPRRSARVVSGLALAGVLLVAAPASADRYDEKTAGHPLRIAAYLLHPVGYAVETLLLRPGHWLVSREPLKTVFGHTD